jgi:hypothetical protein
VGPRASRNAVILVKHSSKYFGQFLTILKQCILTSESACNEFLHVHNLSLFEVYLIMAREAVSFFKRLVAGFSPRRPEFASGSVSVGFVVDKVVMERGFYLSS